MFFGQGPWTPWQMFAFGIIGFLAGLLFKKGKLIRSPISLAVFGSLATFFIYGLIMDLYVVITFQSQITIGMILASLIQGIPFNLVHAIATATFLIFISKPMLEKLDRVKVKYGLMDG
jgi:energy-coupling factor transport system substrate-specific component